MSLAIVGATSGIAQAVATEFARHGHRLQLYGRDRTKLAALGAHWREQAECHELDVFDTNAIARCVAGILASSDSDPYVLVAVGSTHGVSESALDVNAALALLDVNFRQIVALLTPLAEAMASRGNGCIIVISSVAGDRGRQSNYVYGAAKAGLTAYAAGLRNRLYRRGVHVLTVIPGFVDTDMLRSTLGDAYGSTPKFLIGQPENVAKQIYRAAVERKDVIYVPGRWRIVMAIIKAIPERIFKRLSL